MKVNNKFYPTFESWSNDVLNTESEFYMGLIKYRMYGMTRFEVLLGQNGLYIARYIPIYVYIRYPESRPAFREGLRVACTTLKREWDLNIYERKPLSHILPPRAVHCSIREVSVKKLGIYYE